MSIPTAPSASTAPLTLDLKLLSQQLLAIEPAITTLQAKLQTDAAATGDTSWSVDDRAAVQTVLAAINQFSVIVAPPVDPGPPPITNIDWGVDGPPPGQS